MPGWLQRAPKPAPRVNTRLLPEIKPRGPHYGSVPKNRDENLRMREYLLAEGVASKPMAEAIWRMCSEDILFFMNYFVWLYEPRRDDDPIVPFLTWPYQDDTILTIDESIGKNDLLIEKSRDMGVTWMLLLVFFWRWLFRPYQSFLVASRNERAVDATDNPDCLFWKLDFALKWLPPFLKPEFSRMKLNLTNAENGSVIDGVSTTGDLSRGGRRTAADLDEFASVAEGHDVLASIHDVTNSVFFGSTPKGMGNAFADVRFGGKTKVLTLHWRLHPIKAEAIWFDDEGKPRSPWYDRECDRRHLMAIAQELDIDYLGSDFQFFDPIQINEAKAHCREPLHIGEVEYDPVNGFPSGFVEKDKGQLQLWMNLDAWGEAPTDRDFVVGVDVAMGTGASNSVAVVADRKTGEKVAEYASARIKPEDFALYCVALAQLFSGTHRSGAMLIWEANGPGRGFGQKVLDVGYRQVYWRREELKLLKKPTDIPGWWSTKDGRMGLLQEYRDALHRGEYLNRSRIALDETLSYVVTESGVMHSKAKANASPDPTGARENHADRVIADALASMVIGDSRVKAKQPEYKPPADSFWGRRKQHEEHELVKDGLARWGA